MFLFRFSLAGRFSPVSVVSLVGSGWCCLVIFWPVFSPSSPSSFRVWSWIYFWFLLDDFGFPSFLHLDRVLEVDGCMYCVCNLHVTFD